MRNQYSLRYGHTVPRQTASSVAAARLRSTGGRSDEEAAEQPVEDLRWEIVAQHPLFDPAGEDGTEGVTDARSVPAG